MILLFASWLPKRRQNLLSKSTHESSSNNTFFEHVNEYGCSNVLIFFFSLFRLRPQFVPDDLKDDKYWARRRKNNMAAKRSRDARRMKENQIALRAGFLEKEVNFLTARNSKPRYGLQLSMQSLHTVIGDIFNI